LDLDTRIERTRKKEEEKEMTKTAACNKGLASGGANVSVRQFFVNLGFVARSEFSAENPARTPSPEPLAVIV